MISFMISVVPPKHCRMANGSRLQLPCLPTRREAKAKTWPFPL